MEAPKIIRNNDDITQWSARREEILHLLEDKEYGKVPEMNFDITGCVRTEQFDIEGGYSKENYAVFFKKEEKYAILTFDVFYKKSIRKPMPAILHIDPFGKNPLFLALLQTSNLSVRMDQMFPVFRLADEGFAAINVNVGDLSLDDLNRYKEGIMELYPSKGESGWSSISVWAWGISKVVDFVCSDSRFDNSRIVVAGCSRAGKTALWSGAIDTRISAVFSSVSGCCGAAMHRGKTGERISSITKEFPHWSCPKFKEFADKEFELPFDQHMLLSLIAPRPLYITSASEDDWADPPKEFESCVLASQVYNALGAKGLSEEKFPKPNHPICGGDLAYHLREGEHGCRTFDWDNVLPFLKRELNIQ